jgi:hypothetical protein
MAPSALNIHVPGPPAIFHLDREHEYSVPLGHVDRIGGHEQHKGLKVPVYSAKVSTPTKLQSGGPQQKN